jgi:hypothetical protein
MDPIIYILAGPIKLASAQGRQKFGGLSRNTLVLPFVDFVCVCLFVGRAWASEHIVDFSFFPGLFKAPDNGFRLQK